MLVPLFLAYAAASPSQRGVLPSATPTDFRGHVSVHLGATVVCGYGCGIAYGGAVSAALSPADGLVVHAAVAEATDGWHPYAALAVRQNLATHDSWRLAAFVSAVGRARPSHRPDTWRDAYLGIAPGLAFEVGNDRVLFDVSYAPVLFDVEDERSEPTYNGSDLRLRPLPPDVGVSFIGPNGHSRFRLSPLGPSWTRDYERSWLTVTGHVTLVVNYVVFEVGTAW